MAIVTHRDTAQTANSSSAKLKPQHDTFTIRVPLSTSEISQIQSPDRADAQQATQSGCVSRFAVVAIEQQQIITVAVYAAWTVSPQPCDIVITRPSVRRDEFLEKSYFACLSDDAMVFLEVAAITVFFDLDDEN